MTSTGAQQWLDDKLKRHESAKFLSRYVEHRYSATGKKPGEDTFVLNLNCAWGFGKTYFLQNWKMDLEDAGFPVIYYDAWKNDFCDEPLLGFMSDLEKGLKVTFKRSTKAQGHINSIIKTGKNLFRPSLPLLSAALVKKLTGLSIEEFNEYVGDGGSETTKDDKSPEKSSELVSKLIERAAEEALKEHRTRQQYIDRFREHLAELIRHIEKNLNSMQLPIVVMIDELDRCRPSYAIELLENVKHIFGVPGIYFVVATDSSQLAASVKAIYGSEFNAEQYLQRFFDQEYVLPEPDYPDYSAFLFSRLPPHQESCLSSPFSIGRKNEPHSLVFAGLARLFGLSLRSQNQCFETLRAIVLLWNDQTQPLHIPYVLFLIFLRHIRKESFEQFVSNPIDFRLEGVLHVQHLDNMVVQTFRPKPDGFGASPATLSLLDIVSTYARLSTYDGAAIARQQGNLLNEHEENVCSNLLRLGMFSKERNPLSKYPALVRQAGQLQ